jgi:hypothetical protein
VTIPCRAPQSLLAPTAGPAEYAAEPRGMMFGKYGQRGQWLPRVLHISVARYRAALPAGGEPFDVLVSIHEEGTGLTWQQNVTIEPPTEDYLLDTTTALFAWSLRQGTGSAQAVEQVRALGDRLYQSFIGDAGTQILSAITPTAILLDVDETILNLPWELIATPEGPLSQRIPFGRLVTTRITPKSGRDPVREDAAVRILVVANPTGDLPAAEVEAGIVSRMGGARGGFRVDVDELIGRDATKARLLDRLAAGDYDILHFAGHAFLDAAQPDASAVRLADGVLSADDVLGLPWKAPPYLVFNSACESGRAAGGRRLVSGERHANGLAAAFLAAGAHAYAGYFWPVTDVGANMFAGVFYENLFRRENVGLAFLDARRATVREMGDAGDLTGFSAVLFGDAASSHRRDLAMAA